MGGFRLDTSGAVEMRRDLLANGVPAEPDRVTWPDLSPFEQGYVEALFASLRDTTKPWGFAKSPMLNGYRIVSGGDWKVFGRVADASAAIDQLNTPKGFSDLAPETLAAIRKDCATVRQTGFYGDTDEDGANFFRERQRNENPSYPPLAITLSDDGKVRTSPVDDTADPLSRSGKTQTPTPSLGTQAEQDR